MKSIKIIVVLLLLFTANLFAEEVDEIAAVVGDEVIPESEVAETIKGLKASRQNQQAEVNRSEVLEMLINEELILQKARQEDITVEDSEVERRLQQSLRRISKNFSTQEQFQQALEMQGMTLEELKQNYREEISKQLLKEKILNQEVFPKIDITEYEKKQFYQTHLDSFPQRPRTVKIGKIVVRSEVGSKGKENALSKIKNIKSKLNRGADFEELAQEYSDCTSASSGGNLGYFSRGDMVKPFEEVAFNLKEGEISEPVLTQFGYHLIRLDDKKDKKIKVHHILIETQLDEADKNAAKQEIEKARQKLEQGDKFTKVAQEFSDSLQNPEAKNFIVEYPVENISDIPDFSEVISNLEKNEISKVIEHNNNYYLFVNLGYNEPRPYEYDEITMEIENMLQQQKRQEAIEKWVEKLKDEMYVKIYN